MNPSERYHLLAPLSPAGGWRRALALDRQGGAPRAVVLSFPPSSLLEDPVRLAALVRDAEAAARVNHPAAVQVLGLQTADDQLALVEAYLSAVSLRALLDSSGRLPPDLAVRVACDACAGLAAVHAVDMGDGHPLAHGELGPERILVGADGTARIAGLGAHGGRSPEEDVRAVAAALHEALAGEPLAVPPRPLEAPGVPPDLAAVVDRAVGAAPGGPFASAGALGEALAAALSPAPHGALAAYAEAAGPAGEGQPRADAVPDSPEGLAAAEVPPPEVPGPLLMPEVSAELVAPELELEDFPVRVQPAPPPGAPFAASGRAAPPEARPLAEPPRESFPARLPPDAAVTFAAPALAQRRSRIPLAVAVVLGLVGFAVGFALARTRMAAPGASPIAAAEVRSAPAGDSGTPSARSLEVATTEGAAQPALARAHAPPAPAPSEASARSGTQAPAPAPAKAPAKATPALAITATPAGEVSVDGKRAGRAPVTVAVAPGEHEVRLRDAAEGIDVRRRVVARGPVTRVRFELGRGTLDVTAPDDAEVIVDGRLVGKGRVKVELWEGHHRVEAQLGASRVQERFEIARGETWTYAVTPTP